MTPIRFRRKNTVLLCGVAVFVTIFCFITKFNPFVALGDFYYLDNGFTRCNKRVVWNQSKPGKTRVVALLGPEGSGVHWVRFLIEQSSGIHTGSVYNTYPRIFKGEGVADGRVVSVFSHSVSKLPAVDAGIVVYRNMKDTVRTHYARLHGPLMAEGAVNKYQGAEWQIFTQQKSRVWADKYKMYLGSNKPLLFINYEDLFTKSGLKTELSKISKFLEVPVSEQVIDCIASHLDFPLIPKPLRPGFQPFNLLPRREAEKLQILEEHIQSVVQKQKDQTKL